MRNGKIERLEKKIDKVKAELSALGDMRPGSLSQQYQKPKEKKGAFFQLSYTYRMKSRSEYVRPEMVEQVNVEVANFKRFKALTSLWVDLALEKSKLKMELAKTEKQG